MDATRSCGTPRASWSAATPRRLPLRPAPDVQRRRDHRGQRVLAQLGRHLPDVQHRRRDLGNRLISEPRAQRLRHRAQGDRPVHVRDNLIAGNRVGVYIDGSPFTTSKPGEFTRNTLAYNDVGFTFLPSARGNELVGTTSSTTSTRSRWRGGALEANAFWKGERGNFWSDYTGYDQNADGIGDFVHESQTLFENMMDKRAEAPALPVQPRAAGDRVRRARHPRGSARAQVHRRGAAHASPCRSRRQRRAEPRTPALAGSGACCSRRASSLASRAFARLIRQGSVTHDHDRPTSPSVRLDRRRWTMHVFDHRPGESVASGAPTARARPRSSAACSGCCGSQGDHRRRARRAPRQGKRARC
jgi:hypothetical protein